ncbi:MAG: sugar ABC transporter substrate-binding protein [Anaerolineaceae bacterium]
MTKKLLPVMSILMVLVLILTACAAKPTAAPAATEAPVAATEAPVATEAMEPVEVTFWHAYGTGSAEELALAKNLEQAAIDMPEIKINVLQVPFNDIFTKYSTDVAAGGGPDMFIAPNDNLGNDARAGLLADITELAAGQLDGVSQLGIDGMSLDGVLYGIPETLKAVTLWYNKELLPTPPATTDELLALMQGGTEVAFAYGCYHNYGFFSAFGGEIFDADWKVVADQGTGVVDAMTWLNELYQVSKANSWTKTDSDGLAPFSEGKAVAIVNGNWAMGDYKTALGDKLGIAPLPAGPVGPAKPMLGVDGFYFNPNSTNQEAALKVALYLTNVQSQTVMMDEAGHVPVRTDITISDPLIQGLVDAFNVGATIRPQVPELGLYWSNFCGTDQVYEQGITPDAWVKAGAETANK